MNFYDLDCGETPARWCTQDKMIIVKVKVIVIVKVIAKRYKMWEHCKKGLK